MSQETSRRPEMVNVPVRMPKALSKKVNETSERLHLSKQDTMRLSMERGLEILERQLTSKPEMAA